MDIHSCCMRGDLEQLRRLISENVDINAKDNVGWTPLHNACYMGQIDIVCELIKHKPLFNEINNYGNTPLHVASRQGYLNIVNELIKHSDSSIQNKFGETVFDIATTEEIKQFLSQYFSPEVKEPSNI